MADVADVAEFVVMHMAMRLCYYTRARCSNHRVRLIRGNGVYKDTQNRPDITSPEHQISSNFIWRA